MKLNEVKSLKSQILAGWGAEVPGGGSSTLWTFKDGKIISFESQGISSSIVGKQVRSSDLDSFMADSETEWQNLQGEIELPSGYIVFNRAAELKEALSNKDHAIVEEVVYRFVVVQQDEQAGTVAQLVESIPLDDFKKLQDSDRSDLTSSWTPCPDQTFDYNISISKASYLLKDF